MGTYSVSMKATHPKDVRTCGASLSQCLARHYDLTCRQFGPSPASVLWQSRGTQAARFKALMAVAGDDRFQRRLSLNDVGCGYGALWFWLGWTWRWWQRGTYTGYDISPVMLEMALSRITSPRARFMCSPYPLEPADYTVASGLFGLKLGATDQEWDAWVETLILHMAHASRRGLACNFLNKRTRVSPQPTLWYTDPETEYDRMRRLLPGAYIWFAEPYLPGDFTLLVRF